MDLRVYYQKIRQIETGLGETHVVVVSQETPDGGRAGVWAEVPRRTAAQMVVEGKARLAAPEEASQFREQTAAAKQAADQLAAAARVQFTVVSDADLRALKGGARTKA